MATGIFTTKQQAQGVRQKLWTTTVAPSFVDALVVAGGGGSPGGTNAGGGGGGGFVNSIVPVITGSALTVTVGAGGTAGANGSNSVFRTTGATGGGTSNAIGGSGGGTSPTYYPYGPSIQGLFGQGNAGGPAQINAGAGGEDSAGGGGGAGSTGSSGKADSRGGGGGYGAGSIITGTTTAYAGGGGGSMQNSGYSIGNGGAGGGGTGASGTANTGGGAGTSYSGATNGGSGVVVISYPDTFAAAASTTGSPTISTSGSGSIAFNGSTQWATYQSSSAWTLGSTFTIEAWVYPTNLAGGSKRISQSDAGFDFAVAPTGVVLFNAATTTATVSLNVWTHLAFVCNSGTSTLYINGVASGFTGTNTGVNVTGTSTLTVGTYQVNSGFVWQGYISNFRIVKSSAVYTSNFTPSTAPLTAITNTQLLLSANSGGFLADGSSNGFSTTTTSALAPTWNSASPFSVTGYKNRVYRWTSSGSITF